MSQTLVILLVVAVGLTAAVLVAGIVSMARGGEFNRRNANRLMRLRVAFQAVAILIVVVILLLAKGS